jgi:hypothetical protein
MHKVDKNNCQLFGTFMNNMVYVHKVMFNNLNKAVNVICTYLNSQYNIYIKFHLSNI